MRNYSILMQNLYIRSQENGMTDLLFEAILKNAGVKIAIKNESKLYNRIEFHHKEFTALRWHSANDRNNWYAGELLETPYIWTDTHPTEYFLKSMEEMGEPERRPLIKAFCSACYHDVHRDMLGLTEMQKNGQTLYSVFNDGMGFVPVTLMWWQYAPHYQVYFKSATDEEAHARMKHAGNRFVTMNMMREEIEARKAKRHKHLMGE